MNVDELVKQIKDLIKDNKLDDAKKFITDHKDDLGEHAEALTKLLGANADGLLDKVKGFFGAKD